MVYVENLQKEKRWTFPKGHPENKETPEEAALREVREETGWACQIQEPLTEVEYFFTHKKVRYRKRVKWFLMKPLQKQGVFQEGEILDCQWFSLSEAEKNARYPSDQTLLKKLNDLIA